MVSGTFVVSNSRSSLLKVRLEPWCDSREVLPGQQVRIAFKSPLPGVLEIEVSETEIVVFGWEASILEFLEPKKVQ